MTGAHPASSPLVALRCRHRRRGAADAWSAALAAGRRPSGRRPASSSSPRRCPIPASSSIAAASSATPTARAVDAFAIRPGEPLTFRLRVPDLLAAFDRVAKGGAAGARRVRRAGADRALVRRLVRAASTPARRPAISSSLILDDLTERQRSERMRVDFVANASHELRTPLASLAGFIETLQGPARDDAEARERFLAIMQRPGRRA